MRAPSLAACSLLLCQAVTAQSQPPDTTNGWNSQRALELFQRARARREEPRGDTALRSYSAKATGHVYFYLDRQESDERTLVKVDQVALELYWAAPNLTKQRIVGLRDVSRLPNRMHYHLDHLTVVQNGFADIIRLGDGDEVRDVPHPAAPGADQIYDYRLADSLSLTFPPQPAIRVYELQVRPKRSDRSAMIGSLFIDQASADIVRLTFTFTPASYVDRRLDYINISLDNGLWSGKYWLPNEQYVEIRRQVPELDFVAGAVIKGRMRVSDYEFNRPYPRDFFYGQIVEAVPEAERKAFAFEEGIYSGLDREELAPPPQVETLRAQAMELLRKRKLSGLPPLRLHIPNVSSVLRHNESEGMFMGMGAAYVPSETFRMESAFGYAIRAEKPELTLSAQWPREESRVTARAYFRERRDLGLRPPLPEGINTLSSILDIRDYFDFYFASGGDIGLNARLSERVDLRATLGLEQHRAPRVSNTIAPVVVPRTQFVYDGWLGFARVDLGARLKSTERTQVRGDLSFEAGRFEPGDRAPREFFPEDTDNLHLRTVASVTSTYASEDRSMDVMMRFTIGSLGGDAPFQRYFMLGGLNTIPANEHRGMVGRRFMLAEAEVARDVWRPWIRARATAAGGGSASRNTPASIYESATSIGVGVGLFWDILRLNVYHGRLGTRAYFSVTPSLWDTM
jgi:hypothetical protein